MTLAFLLTECLTKIKLIILVTDRFMQNYNTFIVTGRFGKDEGVGTATLRD